MVRLRITQLCAWRCFLNWPVRWVNWNIPVVSQKKQVEGVGIVGMSPKEKNFTERDSCRNLHRVSLKSAAKYQATWAKDEIS